MAWCFAFGSNGFHRGIDGPATLMTEYDNQAGAQNIDAVLDASQAFIVEHVARYSNDEQISEALIKDDLRWHTRIGTTQDNRKWVLTFDEFCASVGGLLASYTEGNRAGIFIAVGRHVLSFINRLMRMLRVPGSETTVAFFQPRDRFSWRHNRLIRMSGISGFREFACAKQTDCDQARREVCPSHLPILSVGN